MAEPFQWQLDLHAALVEYWKRADIEWRAWVDDYVKKMEWKDVK